MLQGISDTTNIGIYHAVTNKISKQKKNSNISNNDNNNNNNNKNKSNNFNINSIDFTKIGHHLFLHSKSAPDSLVTFSFSNQTNFSLNVSLKSRGYSNIYKSCLLYLPPTFTRGSHITLTLVHKIP